MARYGVDYESVRDAAQRLRDDGEPVTVERLRATLGTGSFTTLGRHLRAWRHLQTPGEHTPSAMPQMINDAAQTVWANLTRAAEQRVTQAEHEAEARIARAEDALQVERAQLQAQMSQCEAMHTQAMRLAEVARQAMRLERDAWVARAQEVAADAAATQAQLQGAEASVMELRARCDTQTTSLAGLQAWREEYGAHAKDLRELLVHGAQHDEAAQARTQAVLATLQAQVADQGHHMAEHRGQIDRLEELVRQQQHQLVTMAREMASARAAQSEAEIQRVNEGDRQLEAWRNGQEQHREALTVWVTEFQQLLAERDRALGANLSSLWQSSQQAQMTAVAEVVRQALLEVERAKRS